MQPKVLKQLEVWLMHVKLPVRINLVGVLVCAANSLHAG
jgi:hypothetical protein